MTEQNAARGTIAGEFVDVAPVATPGGHGIYVRLTVLEHGRGQDASAVVELEPRQALRLAENVIAATGRCLDEMSLR